MEELRNGTRDIKAFRDSINAIANADPGLDSRRREILGFSQAAADTAAQLPDISRSVSDVTDKVNVFILQLASVDSKPLQAELQARFDKASQGQEPINGILQSLAALEQANPNFAGIIAGFSGILKAAAQTDAALDELGKKYFANAGSPANGRQSLPVGLLPDNVNVLPEHANKEDLGAAFDKAIAKANRKGHKSSSITAEDQFSNDLQGIKDRSAGLMEEFNALGLSYEAQTKRKISLQLEQTALKKVREEARKKGDADWQNAQLTPDQIAKINAVSDAYAKQAEALKEAQAAQQMQRDILQGVFDDLRSSLEAVQLSWKTFGDIALHVLDKIIAKIEGDLIDSIMQANSAAGGGGGGGILGGILGLFTGGGGGGSTQPPAVNGDPWFGMRANGGPVLAGKPYIVGEKRPELFVPSVSGTILPQVPSLAGGSSQSNSIVFAPSNYGSGRQRRCGSAGHGGAQSLPEGLHLERR